MTRPAGIDRRMYAGSIGMMSRKLIAIVTATPIPTKAAVVAPRSKTRLTTTAVAELRASAPRPA